MPSPERYEGGNFVGGIDRWMDAWFRHENEKCNKVHVAEGRETKRGSIAVYSLQRLLGQSATVRDSTQHSEFLAIDC